MKLILDHLGWFDSQSKAPGTIETIMKEKGETVTRVVFDPLLSIKPTKDSEIGKLDTDGVAVQKDGDLLEWLPKLITDLEEKDATKT